MTQSIEFGYEDIWVSEKDQFVEKNIENKEIFNVLHFVIKRVTDGKLFFGIKVLGNSSSANLSVNANSADTTKNPQLVIKNKQGSILVSPELDSSFVQTGNLNSKIFAYPVIKGLESYRISGFNSNYSPPANNLSVMLTFSNNEKIRSSFVTTEVKIGSFLNEKPNILGPSASLGNKSNIFNFNYSATDADNESITSKVTLNGTTIDTATSATGNIATRTVTIPQNVWDALTINTAYTITIAVTDAKGETATSTHTFTKVNAAPTAQLVEPKGDAVNVPIVDKIQPILVWNFKDTDIADVQSAYRVVVEDLNGLVVHDSLKKTGTASYYQVPINLEWTKTYKWKVTVWDRYDVPSNVSEYGFFKPNRAPNLRGIVPGSADKLLPTKVGSTPIYTWTFEDLDVEAQAAYQLQIFQTADDAIVYNTNRVSKNVQTHTIPENVLLPGVGYYAILTVWDPNNLSATSEKLYIATNATPSAPTLTRPIDNFRTPIKPVLAAVIGTDPENDKQHFKIQLSQDKDFASGVVEFSSLTSRTGWKVDGFDIPVEGVDNSSAGKSVELTLQTNLEKNKTYYWRMAAIDTNTKAVGKYSTARKIRVGNRIEYNTLKRQIPTEATAARRILVALDYTLAKDGATPSTIRVYVSNNALDVTPTWEDATTEFLRQDYYTFKNATKTAAKFGVGVKVVIQANDSMEPISINAAGITFD